MPKFFNARDLDFIKTISEEIVDYVVEQAIVLFKVSVGETKTNLYGESIKECKEHIIYLNTDTITYSSDKYYAFPYSELNKIITQALLFTFDGDHIISSQYPKHPLTNKKFTLVELEYI